MANCDIPDLDLLPKQYQIPSIRFSAGLELGFMHIGLWLLSWAIRLGAPLNLPRYASVLLKASDWCNVFGTADSSMHVIIHGKNMEGKAHSRSWFLIAKKGDGPQTLCVPAILLTKKLLLSDEVTKTGAYPCLGIISLDEYMDELKQFNIQQFTY